MAGLRDVLARFRPAGVPGAPALGAVPGDRAAEQDAELAPLLATLAEIEDQAARIRTGGCARATAIRERGEHDAAAIVERARRDAEAVRKDAEAQARAAGAARAAALLTSAEAEAERLRERAAEPVAASAVKVVAALADELWGRS